MATVRPDQAGLDSYVDPDEVSMGGSVAGVKAITTMLVVAVLNISLKLWTTHPLPYPGWSLYSTICFMLGYHGPSGERAGRASSRLSLVCSRFL
jgi:hypothetical protein